jgi:hypothetical protein
MAVLVRANRLRRERLYEQATLQRSKLVLMRFRRRLIESMRRSVILLAYPVKEGWAAQVRTLNGSVADMRADLSKLEETILQNPNRALEVPYFEGI